MTLTNSVKKIPTVAIIGCGPRGLSALESLYSVASASDIVPNVIVFERTEHPGAGQVWDPEQSQCNWLNVSERAVDIPQRKEIRIMDFIIPEFPNFQRWIGYFEKEHPETEPDKFGMRVQLGEYLSQRFRSIADVLEKLGVMTYIEGEVDYADVKDDHVIINILGGKSFTSNEAVLTIGHQPIEFDEQLAQWQNRAIQLDGVELFTQPYPLNRILKSKGLSPESSVAIRGFGLAMMDVVRALTQGRGGTFKILNKETRKMQYLPSGQEPKSILPFSLDGLPMASKPVNKKIDMYYVPSKEQLERYKTSVHEAIHKGEVPQTTAFLIDAIAPLVSQKFLALNEKALEHDLTEGEIQSVAKSWLLDGNYEHEFILSKKIPAEKTMERFVGMANGTEKVSLDFCSGHVWRHCQPTMYDLISFAPLSDELIAEIVALDERLKRYSYGPPIDSLQQLLALIRASILSFDFVKDPEIELSEKGWQIGKEGKRQIANIMVNSVLDAPQILKVVSPLPKSLLNESEVEPLHDDLGIRTDETGLVETENDNGKNRIAVLGRLAKGTLIGVDAIAECFGKRSRLWAEGFRDRNL